MSDKEELIEILKKWVQIDNTILKHKAEIKDLKTEQKDLTDLLLNIMKSNEIECFDIKDGKILYTTRKTKAPLNKKNLEKMLSNYFEEDMEKANNLCEYLLNNREEKVTENIKRKINK